jgi:acetamidase/formamidase
MPWGQELPLRPFFGVMAVAPPAAWGKVSTLPPRRNGGNLDNKELVAGATLYLPIHVDGALFSVGDVRATQVVDGSKGTHMMPDKRYLARAA